MCRCDDELTTSKISEKVYMIDTLALGQPNSVAAYLLKGSKKALVDCGYATSRETVLEGLGELGVLPSEIDYIIPTHVHLDHGGAAGHLIREMPRATVIAQERGVPHLVDPTRLVQSAISVFGEELINRYGRPLGIDKERITPVGEEMHLDLGGLSLTAVHSPGHAPHQLSVFVEEEKLLLTADAVGMIYPSVPILIPTTPPPSLNPTELGRTTERLGELGSKRLLVPHYGVLDDPEAVLEATRTKTDAWVDRVKELQRTGMSIDEITSVLEAKVAEESGIGQDAFPTYVKISVKTNVMGILHYLEKTR